MGFGKNILKFGRSTRRLWIEAGGNTLTSVVTEDGGDALRIVAKLVSEVGPRDLGLREYASSIRERLSEFLAENDLNGIRAVCVLPSHLVWILPLNFPQMSPAELKKAIRLAIVGQMRIAADEICFDFVQVPRMTGGRMCLDVVAVVAKQKDVRAIIDVIESAGCVVEEVTAPLGQYGDIIHPDNEAGEDSRNSLVIDIGRGSSRFIFFEGQKARYYRSDERLCEQKMLASVDRMIAIDSGTLRLSADEAKQVIRHYGISQENGEDEVTGKKMPLFQLYSMLRPYSERMVAMTRNVISRYVRDFEALNVESIFLTGQGSYIKGLPEYMEKALGITTRTLTIGQEFMDSDESSTDAGELEGELGHVMAASVSNSGNLSLLPRSVVINRLASIGTRVSSVFFVTLLAVLTVFYLGFSKRTKQYEGILSKMGITSVSETEVEEQSRILKSVLYTAEWYETMIDQTSPQQMWIGVLGDTGRLMPSNMRLTKLNFRRTDMGPVIELNGEATQTSGGDEASVFEYAKLLESSPFVAKVLDLSQEDKQKGDIKSDTIVFTVKFQLCEPPGALRRSEISDTKGRRVASHDEQ